MILERPFVDDAPVKDTEIAWLAGIWDGEGSTSAYFANPNNISPRIQMQMTDRETVDRCIVILDKIGITLVGFGYQEKKAHHKDAYHLRINRVPDAAIMARALIPYSVTKLPMWQLMLEFCELKMLRRRVMPNGCLARGGTPKYPTTDREREIGTALIALNYRKKPSDMEVSE